MFDRMVLVALALVLLTPGCNKSEKSSGGTKAKETPTKNEPAKCKVDGDCTGGNLCESGACVPADVARKVRNPPQPSAAVAPVESAAPSPEAAADEGPIPLIPTEKSAPPQGTEWNDGKEINTQEKNSQPGKCTMRVLREWLQVNCREDYSSYEKMENFGRKNTDYFELIQPGKTVSFVVRLQKGKTQSVRICGEDQRASLFVNWPEQKDRPTHVALGKGGACEKDEKKPRFRKKQ